MSFTIPPYIHALRNAPRLNRGFERPPYSDRITAALHALENFPLKKPNFYPHMKDLIAEQQYLLPGFRHLVMVPDRRGGVIVKLGPGIPIYMLLDDLKETLLTDPNEWLECVQNTNFLDPFAIAEVLVFAELFPIALQEPSTKIWRARDFWLDLCKSRGLEPWDASEDEKREYYKQAYPRRPIKEWIKRKKFKISYTWFRAKLLFRRRFPKSAG